MLNYERTSADTENTTSFKVFSWCKNIPHLRRHFTAAYLLLALNTLDNMKVGHLCLIYSPAMTEVTRNQAVHYFI